MKTNMQIQLQENSSDEEDDSLVKLQGKPYNGQANISK